MNICRHSETFEAHISVDYNNLTLRDQPLNCITKFANKLPYTLYVEITVIEIKTRNLLLKYSKGRHAYTIRQACLYQLINCRNYPPFNNNAQLIMDIFKNDLSKILSTIVW